MTDTARLIMHRGAGVETPSQAIVNAANKVATTTDARGRVLGIRKLGLLEKMRLLRVVGSELASNLPWLGLATVAASVVTIDGDQCPTLGTVMQIEAMVDRLEDEGINAAAKAYNENFGETASESELLDAAKN